MPIVPNTMITESMSQLTLRHILHIHVYLIGSSLIDVVLGSSD